MAHVEQIHGAMPIRALLRRPQVQALTGLARSSLYALIAKGEFPAAIPLTGGRAVAWDSMAVSAWIQSRITAAST